MKMSVSFANMHSNHRNHFFSVSPSMRRAFRCIFLVMLIDVGGWSGTIITIEITQKLNFTSSLVFQFLMSAYSRRNLFHPALRRRSLCELCYRCKAACILHAEVMTLCLQTFVFFGCHSLDPNKRVLNLLFQWRISSRSPPADTFQENTEDYSSFHDYAHHLIVSFDKCETTHEQYEMYRDSCMNKRIPINIFLHCCMSPPSDLCKLAVPR